MYKVYCIIESTITFCQQVIFCFCNRNPSLVHTINSLIMYINFWSEFDDISESLCSIIL